MRDLSTEMIAYIKNNVTSLHLCWEIQRKDGIGLYFTEYDEDVIIGGNTYKKRNGGIGQSLRFGDLLAGNDSNIDMILVENDGITLSDLYNFKYDSAEIFVSLVHPDDPDDQIKLVYGLLGNTQVVDGVATINYTSIMSLLNKSLGRIMAAECDAELFDDYCSADTTGHQFFNQSVTGIDPIKPFTVFTDTTLDKDSGWFDEGYFVWTSGNNEGIETKVKTQLEDVITLSLGMPNEIQTGDEFTIYSGCNKIFSTCREKFDNILNFKGFPTIPNADKVSTYS